MTVEFPSQLNVASWFIDRPAQEHPDRIALLGEPCPVSYGELRDLTNRAGNALLARGCKPGDRVLIGLVDSVEFVASFFGAAKIGAIAVPVNPQSHESEISYYLADSGAKIAMVDAGILSRYRPARERNSVQWIVVGETSQADDEERSWANCIANSIPVLEAYPTATQDPAFFLYSSGSTGRPKAAVHEHKNMLVTTLSFAQGVLGLGPDDRTFSIPKLFFGYGLANGMYFPLAVGARTILNPDSPRLDKVARMIARHRPTILFAVPTFLHALCREIDNGLEVDLSSIRLIVYGGEPASPELFDRFHNRFGMEMIEGLGSTEVGQTFLSNRPGQARAGTCGIEVPNYEVRLVGDDGQPVCDGEIGTLWVKGKSSFLGYWNKPELTARAKVGEWVVTGDKLYRDELGYYHFCGRGDDMLKVSGMWVSPPEIEFALCQHPDVEQAVVVTTQGSSEPKQLVAYVVVRQGRTLDSGELRRYIGEKLSSHMMPDLFIPISEFPLTGSGKIDRMSLPNPTAHAENNAIRHLSDVTAPRTPTEATMTTIWCAVLNIPQIGVFDDFLELGGTSILALECVSRIERTFQVEVPLTAFFADGASVSTLAGLVDGMRSEERSLQASKSS